MEHFVSDGIYFSAKKEDENVWQVEIDAEVKAKDELQVVYELKAKNSETIQKLVGEETVTKEDGIFVHHLKAKVNHPDIWDVEHPDYYELIVSLYKGTELISRKCRMSVSV